MRQRQTTNKPVLQPRRIVRREPQSADARVLRVGVDWKATFAAFCLAHGNRPVVLGGLLLFEDGWRHSLTDYEGPALPPPEDRGELRRLQRFYWKRRAEIARARRDEWAGKLRQAEDLLRLRPDLVQWQEVESTSADGKPVREVLRGPLDLEPLRARLAEAERELQEAVAEVEALGVGKAESQVSAGGRFAYPQQRCWVEQFGSKGAHEGSNDAATQR